MRRPARAVATLALALLALSHPSLAVAAPAPWASMDVTLIEEGGQTVLLVAGELPTSTPLPAEVALPLPRGAVPQWAGELVDPSGQNDIPARPSRDEQGDADVYRFTVTRSRVAQVEGLIKPVSAREGDRIVTALSWAPIVDVPSVRISARVPAGARIVSARPEEGARLFPADRMWSYFSRTVEDVKAGEPVTLTFAYTLPTAGAPASRPGSNTAAVVVVVLAGLVLLAVFATLIARKRARANAYGGVLLAHELGEPSDAAPENGDPGVGSAPDHADDVPGDVAGPREIAPVHAPSRTRTIVVASVVLVALGIGFYAASRGTSPVAVGDAITQTFGTGEACSTVAFDVEPTQGNALTEQADALMASLAQVPGVGRVSIIPDRRRIEVGYCDSSATEEDLRQAIERSGTVKRARLVSDRGPAPAVPTSPSPDGTAAPDR